MSAKINEKELRQAYRALMDYSMLLAEINDESYEYKLGTESIDHLGHDFTHEGISQFKGSLCLICTVCSTKIKSYSERLLSANNDKIINKGLASYEPDTWYQLHFEPHEKIPSCAEAQMESALE